MRDRIELLEKGWEIRRNWGGGDGCGLNDGGEVRWKLVERARSERVKGSGDDEQEDMDKWKSMGMGYGKKWVV